MAVDVAGPQGFRLTSDSALMSLARELLDDSSGGGDQCRSVIMTLRDLVWRVETARTLILPHLSAELADLMLVVLDTDDIRAYLDRRLADARSLQKEPFLKK